MAKKVLLIDDEADIVTIIKFSLENNGFEAIPAYDGQEGFKKAKECSPDLIILDILMPKGFGDDLGNKINNDSDTQHIPIIFFTNMPVPLLTDRNEKELSLSQDSKGNLYLQKSCTEEQLLKAITKALASK